MKVSLGEICYGRSMSVGDNDVQDDQRDVAVEGKSAAVIVRSGRGRAGGLIPVCG
jgi:hypothetical protein